MSEAGDKHFKDGSAALKKGDRDAAVSHFKQAAEAFASQGEVKKLKLMEGMIAKIHAGEGGPAKKEQASKPAPPKKSAFDYSRFDQIVDSDDEEDSPGAAAAPGRAGPLPPGMGPPPSIPPLPPKLIQAISMAEEIKARGGSKEELKVAEELAAKAMDEASPQVKEGILKTLQQAGVKMDGMQFQGGEVAPGAPGMDNGEDDVAASLSKVEELKRNMKADLDRLKQSMKTIEENEKKLEKIDSPEDMLRFLKKQGATDDELGRVMAASTSGDQRSFDEAVKKVMERTMMGKDGPSMEELKEKMAKIDSVTNAVQNDLVGAIEGLGGGAKSAGAPPSTAEKGANKNKGKGKEKEKEAAPEPTKAPTSAVAKGNAEECKAQGNKLFAAGDYAAAVECFKQAVALSSTPNAGYLTNLAASRLRMGDWDAAVRDADAALAADGTHVKAWFRKGQALEGKCDWDGAEAAYRGGLEHMPDSEQLKAGLESVSAARLKSKEGKGSSGVKEGGEAAAGNEQDKDKSKDKEEGAKLLGTAIAAKLKERREEKSAAAAAAAAAATAGDMLTGPKIPKWHAAKSGESLVVSIEMPLLDKAIADLTLDVSSDRLVLGALPHYSLDCELPSRVDGEKAAAKFVKKTKTLRVTIPLA